MVFSSFPVYLDHPNLHQQLELEQQHGNPSLENHQLATVAPPPLPPGQVGGGGGGLGSIRPGSMVDRARVAKIPLPEAGLKCPRCDSTNTKFCYFNNYNLSQPRHFCKTCRRYWTRGGSLRNVPVGGGCRRNKRSSKSSNNSSKSVAAGNASGERQMGTSTSTSASPSTLLSPSTFSTGIGGHQFSQPSTQLTPLMAAFQNLNHFDQGGLGHEMGFQLGTNTNNLPVASGGPDQWRFPSLVLGGSEPQTNMYHFQGEGMEAISSGVSQVAPVMKMEENNRGLNSTKQFLGSLENNQFWGGGNTWTGFSGLNSSTTNHLL